MIEVENLSKRYGRHLAVDNISFTAHEGEILGILGPNGAGKTSTMRILTGFMPPSGGSASVAGFDVVTDSFEVRARVGYLPERVPLYPDMTVEGMVRFWAELRRTPDVRSRVAEVLEQVRLTERRKSLVRTLSKGLKQRLGLAQALVHNPPVVILDEPTIGIDPQQVIEVRQAVRDLAQTHTVLFSTHILSEAEQVCDRVIIINQGQLVAQGTPAELRQRILPDDRLYIEISGARPEAIRSALTKTRGVTDVVPLAGGFTVTVKGSGVRDAVVKLVADSGWHLLELRPAAVTLEDIFLAVVAGENEERPV